jgi:hypothetical protein
MYQKRILPSIFLLLPLLSVTDGQKDGQHSSPLPLFPMFFFFLTERAGPSRRLDATLLGWPGWIADEQGLSIDNYPYLAQLLVFYCTNIIGNTILLCHYA